MAVYGFNDDKSKHDLSNLGKLEQIAIMQSRTATTETFNVPLQTIKDKYSAVVLVAYGYYETDYFSEIATAIYPTDKLTGSPINPPSALKPTDGTIKTVFCLALCSQIQSNLSDILAKAEFAPNTFYLGYTMPKAGTGDASSYKAVALYGVCK